MRLILMFDLPNDDKKEAKAYRMFHNELIKNGYIMMQFSVYIKTVNATTKVNDELKKIKKQIPAEGNIRMLVVTEKQYDNMVLILGNKSINEIYNNEKRYLKI